MRWSLFQAIDAVLIVRGFYLACCSALLAVRLLPPLQSRFLAYGPRVRPRISGHTSHHSAARDGALSELLNLLAGINVPHGWFKHFYIVSVLSTLVSLISLVVSQRRGSEDVIRNSPESHQPSLQLVVCMLLMLVQGLRRLYECCYVFKASPSTMWIGHYGFGLAFYIATNAAIWIETQRMDVSHSKHTLGTSYRTQVGTLLFLSASVAQYRAHSYLANLKKYTLPDQGLFNVLIAPHYSEECLIYLGLAVVGAPDNALFNYTFMCTVLLVAVNLGITAEGTKAWMLEKFREDEVTISKRYCLMPGIW